MSSQPGVQLPLLNLNSVLPKDSLELQRKQSWFQQVAFRQAGLFGYRSQRHHSPGVSRSRDASWFHVTPANKLWLNATIATTPRSVAHARELLKPQVLLEFEWSAS